MAEKSLEQTLLETILKIIVDQDIPSRTNVSRAEYNNRIGELEKRLDTIRESLQQQISDAVANNADVLSKIKADIIEDLKKTIEIHIRSQIQPLIRSHQEWVTFNNNLRESYPWGKGKHHGDPWSGNEDQVLKKEVHNAINEIAQNHARSFGSIISRINHLKKVGFITEI